jgi:hypothetical protein
MRLIQLQEGKLELRWTWLPYWLAAGPALHNEIQAVMRDAVIINGMPPTDESVERVEAFVLRLIERRFKISGLTTYLRGLEHVAET